MICGDKLERGVFELENHISELLRYSVARYKQKLDSTQKISRIIVECCGGVGSLRFERQVFDKI
jgi:hypothetical protein